MVDPDAGHAISGATDDDVRARRVRLLVLALLSVIAGGAVGLLAAAFRLALGRAERLRDSLLALSHHAGIVGFFGVIGLCAVATATAAWRVKCCCDSPPGRNAPAGACAARERASLCLAESFAQRSIAL